MLSSLITLVDVCCFVRSCLTRTTFQVSYHDTALALVQTLLTSVLMVISNTSLEARRGLFFFVDLLYNVSFSSVLGVSAIALVPCTVNVQDDCPVFDGLWDFCQIAAGGSLAAAARLNSGAAEVAINWAGGLHHAKKAEASGFCYINDCVLAILELLKTHARVLYVDIDIHHGDGVEEAFYSTDRVMTASFHKFGDYFPGTGAVGDVGVGRGRAYSINFPLKDGIDDDSYATIFEPVMSRIMEWYRPGAVVLQCGADSLAGDRLGCFNLSLRGHAACVDFFVARDVPLLLLGGGGYTIRNVARCWSYETSRVLGMELPDDMPITENFEFYGPDFRLHIQPSNAYNHNTPESLHATTGAILDVLRTLPSAPSVPMRDIPRGSPASLFQDGSEEDVPDDERPIKRFASGGRRNAPREFLEGDFATSGAAPSPYTAALPGARARLAPSNFTNFRTAAGSPPPSLVARPLAPSPPSTVWRAPPVSSLSVGAGVGPARTPLAPGVSAVRSGPGRRVGDAPAAATSTAPKAAVGPSTAEGGTPGRGRYGSGSGSGGGGGGSGGGPVRGKSVVSPQPVLPGRRSSPSPSVAGKASPQAGYIDKGAGHSAGDKGVFAGSGSAEVLQSGGGASGRRPTSGGGGGNADVAMEDADTEPRAAPVAASAGLPSGVGPPPRRPSPLPRSPDAMAVDEDRPIKASGKSGGGHGRHKSGGGSHWERRDSGKRPPSPAVKVARESSPAVGDGGGDMAGERRAVGGSAGRAGEAGAKGGVGAQPPSASGGGRPHPAAPPARSPVRPAGSLFSPAYPAEAAAGGGAYPRGPGRPDKDGSKVKTSAATGGSGDGRGHDSDASSSGGGVGGLRAGAGAGGRDGRPSSAVSNGRGSDAPPPPPPPRPPTAPSGSGKQRKPSPTPRRSGSGGGGEDGMVNGGGGPHPRRSGSSSPIVRPSKANRPPAMERSGGGGAGSTPAGVGSSAAMAGGGGGGSKDGSKKDKRSGGGGRPPSADLDGGGEGSRRPSSGGGVGDRKEPHADGGNWGGDPHDARPPSGGRGGLPSTTPR